MTSPFPLEDAALGESASLIVIERQGEEIDDFEIKVADEAGLYLADAWARTLEELQGRELVPYSPEVVIRAGEGRALVITDDLREENQAIELLLADADRPQVRPDEVDSEGLYLYAVVSDTEAGRIAMIKKTNPTKRARAGKRWALARDELALMSDDPWQLHPIFDLVVSEEGGYALNTFFFEQLFAEADRLRARVGDWVDDIAARLPMGAGQRDVLVTRCRDSPRLRRRLRSIAYRGHLARVDVADVRRHLREMGLAQSTFIQKGQLVVDEADIEQLLRLLNEDLMRGGLTKDAFRVEGKEPM